MTEREAQTIELSDLPMFWQGRANAFSILAGKQGQNGESTLMQAKVYEECARELRAALRTASAPIAWRWEDRVYKDEWITTYSDVKPDDPERTRNLIPLYAALALSSTHQKCAPTENQMANAIYTAPSLYLSPEDSKKAACAALTVLEDSIRTAETMLSEHIEEFHDFDYQPHEVPLELQGLRNIQHHLLGTLVELDPSVVSSTHDEGK